jgi:hypothetical protein
VVLQSVFTSFLCLSIAIAILLNPDQEMRNSTLNYASKMPKYFLIHCERLYGESFVVYNIHSLLHIAEDVKFFNIQLDNVGAFHYENYLQVVKRFICGTSNPLIQVSKRLHEYEAVNGKPFSLQSDNGHLRVCLLVPLRPINI